MLHFEKHFTLAEANAKISWVRKIFLQAKEMKEYLSSQTNLETFPATSPGFETPPTITHPEGGRTTPRASSLEEEWRKLEPSELLELINRMLLMVHEKGIVIQDVDRGLIDFPGFRNDEEILLCYELNDGDEIVAWHSLTGGYVGRQPIDDLIQ